MKKFLLIICIFTLTAFYALGTDYTFDSMSALLKEHKNSWSVDRKPLCKIFNKIRKNLDSDHFERELINFVEDDLDKIYWCGLFLINEYYLNGNEADFKLAAKIFDIGASIKTNPASEDKNEINLAARQISLKIIYAVLTYKMGDIPKAEELKKDVENTVDLNPMYMGCYPAMSTEDRSIYFDYL